MSLEKDGNGGPESPNKEKFTSWKDYFRVNNRVEERERLRHQRLQAQKEAQEPKDGTENAEMCSQIDAKKPVPPRHHPFERLPEPSSNSSSVPVPNRANVPGVPNVQNVHNVHDAGHLIADEARLAEHLIAEEAGYLVNEAGHMINGAGHMISDHIAAEGESGRRGFNPWLFVQICFSSSSTMSRLVNFLWPVVPPAIVVRYIRSDFHLEIFILNYIAMIPCANLIGFAGAELARKLPKVFGILVETTLGSVVEIILFMVLLSKHQFAVLQAAALGSIMATLLLCLGLCFFFGGLTRDEQTFSDTVSEVGSGLLLTAGLALMIPAAFQHSLSGLVDSIELEDRVLHISRVMSIVLVVAYAMYVWFQMRSHNSIYDAIFEEDELRDADRHKDAHRFKLTFTECVIALAIAITLVTIIAISLVQEISFIVEERGISDTFMGLILVPLVEKAAEHLTAVDEAWDDEMNLALAHVLGATIQTALFNTPLAVIVGWGLNIRMDLNFEIFTITTLILSILVVGNFLRDQKSTYLEGALCVMVYIILAVAAYYFPNIETEAE